MRKYNVRVEWYKPVAGKPQLFKQTNKTVVLPERSKSSAKEGTEESVEGQ